MGDPTRCVLRRGPAANLRECLRRSNDVSRAVASGTVIDVITHEMDHVLGFGKTIWGPRELIDGVGSGDPTFNGRTRWSPTPT
jgi:hypothetical protein